MRDALAILVACVLFTTLVALSVLAGRWWQRRAGWAALQRYSKSGLVAWQLWRRRSKTLRLTDRREPPISDGPGTTRASGPSGP